MKPILFNQDMVKAILDGRKTVTRRVVKLPKHIRKQEDGLYTLFAEGDCYENKHFEEIVDYIEPPYEVGDILYVRETWQNVYETEYDKNVDRYCVDIRKHISNFDDIPKINIGLSTEWSCSLMQPRNKYYVYKASDINYTSEKYELRWRPSIHMPKEAARIFLKVTDVRAERLQEIDSIQAQMEGVTSTSFWEPKELDNKPFEEKWWDDNHFWNNYPQIVFSRLWNSTVKKEGVDKYGWEANPWVWVIAFERCEK